ncbi:hypothetical protein SAMN05444411_1071, partial [Lutibacter oricola]
MNNKLVIAIIFLLGVSFVGIKAQSPVESWTISSQSIGDVDSYSTYNFGQGDNVSIETVTYSGRVFTIPFPSQSYTIRRRDLTPNSSGVNVVGNKASFFIEHSGNTSVLLPGLPGVPGNIDLTSLLRDSDVNLGALDVFKNTGNNSGDEGPQNIERIDVIYQALTIGNSADLDLNGFLATEKSGNNPYKVAAILSVDSNGNPSSFGPLKTINSSSYGNPNVSSYNPGRKYAFYEDTNSDNYPTYVRSSTERMGVSIITFSDLGILPNQPFYGVSFFGDDVNDSYDLVDYNSFPSTTTTGADVHGGLGTIVTATGFDPLDDDGDGVINEYDICNGFDDNADNDNDNIPDGCDLDDDNDGILDTEECNATIGNTGPFTTTNTQFSFTGTGWNNSAILDAITIDGKSYTDFVVPDGYAEGFATANQNHVYEVTNNVNGNTGPTGDNISNPDWNNLILDAFQDRNVNHFQKQDGGIVASDYYNLYYNNPLLIGGDTFLFISERGGNNNTIIEAYDPSGAYLGSQIVLVANSANYLSTNVFAENGQEIKIAVYNISELGPVGSSIASLKVISNSTGDAADGKVFIYTDPLVCQDSDGDSIPDKFDNDSDNDGCPDALEGNASVTTAQLDGLGQITGGVDSNGVPSLVSGGQNDVSSTDDDVASSECTPVAQNDESLNNDTTENVTINVLEDNGSGVDSDPNGTLDASTVSITTTGAVDTTGDGDFDTLVVSGQGTWTLDEAGNITFDPVDGYIGNPTPINYTIEDDDGTVSNEATVTITYEQIPPVADDETAVTTINTPVTVDVLEGDVDPDGDDSNLVITEVNGTPITEGATVTLADGTEVTLTSGELVVTPPADSTDPISFVYTVEDEDGLTDEGQVDITLTQEPPVADDETAVTTINTPVTVDVLEGDVDPDGDDSNLVITEVNGTPITEGATVTLADGTEVTLTSGELVVTPPADSTDPISFVYTVEDEDGLTDEGQVDITLTQEPPVADDETAVTTINTPVTVDVLEGDVDPDGDDSNLVITEVNGTPITEGATVTLADGTEVTLTSGELVVTPPADSTDPISFVYTVEDEDGLTDEGQVDITLTQEPPVADDETAVTTINTPVTV